jgi:hypothetical protein
MNPEIENLINMALADGEVTEKERGIILRKADSFGLDVDEIEMILDGRIALMKKDNTASMPSIEIPIAKPNKQGELIKCPSCGATVNSFQTRCTDCGHEFRNTKAVNSIQKLYDEFQKIEESERSRERSWMQKMDGDLGIQKSVVTRQISALAAFPVPNTKEDLLEFLSIASSEASKGVSWFLGMGQHPDYLFKKAWLSKCEQVIHKARFSMKNDNNTIEQIESIAKKLKIK